KSLVLGFSLVEWTRSGDEGLDMIAYWRRCAYSAAAARRIAVHSSVNCDPEEAFIAALMQDIGMLAIMTTVGREYQQLVASVDAQADQAELIAAERKQFAFDHAQAGAKLAQRWRLPTDIIQAIEQHHSAKPATSSKIVLAVALGFLAAEALTARDG